MKKRVSFDFASSQEFTSASTAVNADHGVIPAVFGILERHGITVDRCLDYGCGKYPLPCVVGLDPWNLSKEENDHALKLGEAGFFQMCVCSNVLNTIREDAVIIEALENIKALSPVAYITIHDGDRSGVGRQTGKDQYQRNQKLSDYLPLCEEVFGPGHVLKKWGMIMCAR